MSTLEHAARRWRDQHAPAALQPTLLAEFDRRQSDAARSWRWQVAAIAATMVVATIVWITPQQEIPTAQAPVTLRAPSLPSSRTASTITLRMPETPSLPTLPSAPRRPDSTAADPEKTQENDDEMV